MIRGFLPAIIYTMGGKDGAATFSRLEGLPCYCSLLAVWLFSWSEMIGMRE